MRFLPILMLLASMMLAQRTPDLAIRPQNGSTTGLFGLEDLAGNRINFRAPNSLTSYNLTWPGTISAGCLTANGSGVLTWQSCVSLPIDDTNALIRGSADATKLIRFEVDGLTTATTRVLTVPDVSMTLAGRNVDNQFSTNQTMRSIEFATANSFTIGATNEASLVRSATFDGTTSSVPGTNWMRTRKLELWDAGGAGAFWYFETAASGAGTSNSVLRDNTGAIQQFWSRSTLGVVDPYSYLAGDWLPDTTGRRLGRIGQQWDANLRNVTISGTCTGCGSGISSLNGMTNSTQTIVFGSSGASPNVNASGGVHTLNIPNAAPGVTAGLLTNSSQLLAGDKTLQGSVLPSAAGIYSLGNSGFPWGNTTSRRFEISDLTGSGLFNTIDAQVNFGNQFLAFKDSSSVSMLTLTRTFFSSPVNRATFDMNIGFTTHQTYDIGAGNWARTIFTRNLETSPTGSVTAYVGSGNFYNRTFAGSPSCAGVADGWTGVDTFNLRIWVCIGGVARYGQLL